MASEKEKNQIDLFCEKLSTFDWPEITKESNKIIAGVKDSKIILELDKEKYCLYFVWYNREESKYEYRSGIEKIVFDENIPLEDLVSFKMGYKLQYDWTLKRILQLESGAPNEQIKTINISSAYKKIGIYKKQKHIDIPISKFKEIINEAEKINKKSKSYGSSVGRFLINGCIEKYLGKSTRKITLSKKGEFNFLINRFNLKLKKSKEKILDYLDKSDISSLQSFFNLLIEKDVFDEDFMKRLDDYFIREKLKDIIDIGNSILALKSTDTETELAKEVISKISKRKISQLESVWQEYFKKYLLYLIFSYKKIYSKIELELDADKKYPDFIGINHYNGVDAIEIKTHLAPALIWDENHKNFSFSPQISKAIIQTMNYMDAIKKEGFKDSSDKEKITDFTDEENLYRPRGIIIISSWDRLTSNKFIGYTKEEKEKMNKRLKRDFTKLRNSLHDIEILTFDEILQIADNYTNNIIKK
ncbi:MAG: Shedu anti-phage system protein SduA domain-containing protein [Chloroherpetonaceae bacterium]